MVLPLGNAMAHFVFVNVSVHPWSHKGATARSDVWRSGKMCARVAWVGNPLRGRLAVCVDVMYCWFATWTCSGLSVGVTCARGWCGLK